MHFTQTMHTHRKRKPKKVRSTSCTESMKYFALSQRQTIEEKRIVIQRLRNAIRKRTHIKNNKNKRNKIIKPTNFLWFCQDNFLYRHSNPNSEKNRFQTIELLEKLIFRQAWVWIYLYQPQFGEVKLSCCYNNWNHQQKLSSLVATITGTVSISRSVMKMIRNAEVVVKRL